MILSQERWMNLRVFKALAEAGASWAEIARETGCGGGGANWTRTSTATLRVVRKRRRLSSSSRAWWPNEPALYTSQPDQRLGAVRR